MAATDQPKYERIAAGLRLGIESGRYPVGSKLPSKSELKTQYGAAQNTVDHAIEILRQLGFVESKQGVATFVISAVPTKELPEYETVMARMDDLAEEIERMRGRVSDLERHVLGEPSSTPEPRPVVAAIVTSGLGVLVGRRHDGKPPWTFIAGEIEPGESPEDAAVREVKEETGLRVLAGNVIGRRVHPKTGRTMVYMAAAPAGRTEVFIGDEDELAEVRWVSLAEADELMGGQIFDPVREHLRRQLPEGPR